MVPCSRCAARLEDVQYQYRHLVRGLYVSRPCHTRSASQRGAGVSGEAKPFQLTCPSMAEMITGYPLFRGRDNSDQLVQIMKIVGTPSEATLAQIKANSVCPGSQ